MGSSKIVFAMRKEGQLDEAYTMALELIELNPTDVWCMKALAWCLFDLVKRSVSQKDYPNAKLYVDKLESLNITEDDDILFKSVELAKMLANPEKQIIFQAKTESKNGNHHAALNLYRQAVKLFPDDVDVNTQFAWELQKEGKIIFEKDPVNVLEARKLLSEYIVLKNGRPSRLHSQFLRFADKIIDKEAFNLVAYLRLWDLNNLTEEDFEQFSKDGKTYPSIGEKIIQHASKLILDKKINHEVEYFLPFLEKAIKHSPDNIWLPYYNAKLLHLVHRNKEAIEFLIQVVKDKISDYWVWSLMSELVMEENRETAISCLCKALLCRGEDKFINNVRLKFAELLILNEHWNEAKFEIETVVKSKKEEGAVVSEKLINYQKTEWYQKALDKKSNNDFYNAHKQLAEEFIFHSLPWMNASLGETFTIPERPDKPRRKIFIQLPNEIIDQAVSDKKFNTWKNYKVGESIKIKGEYDKDNLFQIYLLDKRNTGENWDIFNWHNGIITQIVNKETDKSTSIRVSIILNKQLIEGFVDTSCIVGKIPLVDGLPIFVKYFAKAVTVAYRTEFRIKIHSISARNQGILWDIFPEYIGIIDHINEDKAIAHYIVNKKINGTIKLNQVDEEIQVGSKLSLKLKEVKADNETYFKVLSCNVTDKEPTASILRKFAGEINLSSSFGFADEVFIENSLLSQHNILDGSIISGMAILNFNKKKGSWGWKALKID